MRNALVCFLSLCLCGIFAAENPAHFSVGTFSVDATPPLGHQFCCGGAKPMVAVDDPLLAKGIVLSDGRTRYVICALDWCRLHGGAHDVVCEKMARAAGVPLAQVTVHCGHQHNAPFCDVNAQKLLSAFPDAPMNLDLKFFDELTDRVAAAVKDACVNTTPITEVGCGKARVEHFASNRRVKLPDGTILVRYSAMKTAAAREAPEGLIDPWLRTITFFNGATPVVRLHYYACHPQSYYGDGRATSDTIGLARKRLEDEEHIPQIYFTGCAGDITAGKYNTGTPADRVALTDRLFAGMKAAVADTQRAPLTELRWVTTTVTFPPRTEPEFAAAALQKTLETPSAQFKSPNVAGTLRTRAALFLAWYERLKTRPSVEISALHMGSVSLFHLPGEAFIEYQLYAQRLLPDKFVAVASYGEGGMGYICVDSALGEGGYEPTASLTGIGTERVLKNAIAGLAGVPPLP